eukprot:g3608.t1
MTVKYPQKQDDPIRQYLTETNLQQAEQIIRNLKESTDRTFAKSKFKVDCCLYFNFTCVGISFMAGFLMAFLGGVGGSTPVKMGGGASKRYAPKERAAESFLVIEDDRPLGIELAQRTRGGAIVKYVIDPRLNAKVSRGMILEDVGATDVSQLNLKVIMHMVKEAPRPLTLRFKRMVGSSEIEEELSMATSVPKVEKKAQRTSSQHEIPEWVTGTSGNAERRDDYDVENAERPDIQFVFSKPGALGIEFWKDGGERGAIVEHVEGQAKELGVVPGRRMRLTHVAGDDIRDLNLDDAMDLLLYKTEFSLVAT